MILDFGTSADLKNEKELVLYKTGFHQWIALYVVGLMEIF